MNYLVRRIIIVLVVLFLIFIGFRLLFGGGGEAPVVPTTQRVRDLPEYANTNAEVSMITDGRVNGDDIHRAIRITISRDQRTIDILQGYGGIVIDSRQYYNTLNAYDVFLRSLKVHNFLLVRRNVRNTDDRGQCALGHRYIFELNQQGEQLSRLWSSTCNGIGTFAGSTANLQSLFRLQIPEYDQITARVQL